MNQFGGIIYKSLYHHKSSSSIQLVSVNNESNASDNLWTFHLPNIKIGYKKTMNINEEADPGEQFLS